MLTVTFPDDNYRSFPSPITGIEIAQSVSLSLAKDAVAIFVNDKLKDLVDPITIDCKVRIITLKDDESLEIVRHDAAHVLAQAVKNLFPDVQVTIGPVIDNGFFYDFYTEKHFTEEDLLNIEKEMRNIVSFDHKIVKYKWERDYAIEFFRAQNEFYKIELIDRIPKNEEITVYKQGDFVDLCRGPHSPSTGKIKAFKLLKTSGSYWLGDSLNVKLQRIYGTAWRSKKELEDYLKFLEEAEKRDHRKIGKAMELFHLQEEAPGEVFWHPDGLIIYEALKNYIRKTLNDHGYSEVKTPILLDRKLWEASGHWEKFKNNMFISEIENKIFAVKPMNCPCHIQIFNQTLKSYRDLPLRLAEFGTCHRNESSGSLYGVMRVREFVQDDAHIFCTKDQITSETVAFCTLLKKVYAKLGFENVKIRFSDRPPVRLGDDLVWDEAENALKSALKVANLDYEINSGDGAFYGPKLEFILLDALKREWQCGTLQVDFILPERLGAFYMAEDGKKYHPVMLHRAILGTLERFIGILLEHYEGKLPLWLMPTQVVVITITDHVNEYAKNIFNLLQSAGVRVKIDLDNKKVEYKIHHYSNKKIPFLWIVGKNEESCNTVSIRTFGKDGYYGCSVNEAINNLLGFI